MFARTDTELSPWYVVEADDKRTARLNLISHLLSVVPYEHVQHGKRVKLPPRQRRKYKRPPKRTERLVPTRYLVELSRRAAPTLRVACAWSARPARGDVGSP